MKIVILAGGGGTRLFPLSRSSYPKQFLNIETDRSLLSQTINRYLGYVQSKDIIIVTNQDYFYHVKAEIIDCNAEDAHIIMEPVARNTAPAIALVAKYCIEKLGSDPNEILFICPADHIIKPKERFIIDVKEAMRAAEYHKIVTLGIKPDKPETGYGYIKVGSPWEKGFLVDEFVEKPDEETANRYLKDGSYYWNSGMYAFSIQTFTDELQKYQPNLYDVFYQNSYQEFLDKFSDLENISIDYAIAEKSNKVVTIPTHIYWNDIGSWDAIYDVMDKDDNGNVKNGDCFAINCSNSLIIGSERLVAGIGLEDAILVETDDVVLVAKKGESQKVRDLVEELKKYHRREVHEHTVGFKPWGNYKVIASGPGYKVKKVYVYPGNKLSMQMHYHRSEHWIVIRGTAKVTMENEVRFISENESVFISKATKHRLENPGNMPLEIVEVQNGSYLEDDDIVRFE